MRIRLKDEDDDDDDEGCTCDLHLGTSAALIHHTHVSTVTSVKPTSAIKHLKLFPESGENYLL